MLTNTPIPHEELDSWGGPRTYGGISHSVPPRDIARIRAAAKMVQALFPSFGCCKVCDMPWNIVAAHCVNVNRGGCFLLCEECWQQTPTEEILRIYWNYFLSRPNQDSFEKEWPEYRIQICLSRAWSPRLDDLRRGGATITIEHASGRTEELPPIWD